MKLAVIRFPHSWIPLLDLNEILQLQLELRDTMWYHVVAWDTTWYHDGQSNWSNWGIGGTQIGGLGCHLFCLLLRSRPGRIANDSSMLKCPWRIHHKWQSSCITWKQWLSRPDKKYQRMKHSLRDIATKTVPRCWRQLFQLPHLASKNWISPLHTLYKFTEVHLWWRNCCKGFIRHITYTAFTSTRNRPTRFGGR